MCLCMRTTIDMPDGLMQRVREVSAARNTTFRALVIEALEKILEPDRKPFQLRDASAGKAYDPSQGGLSPLQINQQIDQVREGIFIR